MFNPKVRLCLGTLSLTAALLASCDQPLILPRPTVNPVSTIVGSPPPTDLPVTASTTLNAPPVAGEPPPGAGNPLPTSSGPPEPPPPPPGS